MERAHVAVIGAGVALSAALTIAASYRGPRGRLLLYICKPLTTILILIVALLPGTFPTDSYARAVGVGLVFALAGDVWLLWSERYFLPGLASFLCAHVCYIVAFRSGTQAEGFRWVLLALAAVAAAALMYLWPGLRGGMRPAVPFYVGTITLMAALAVGRAMSRLPGGMAAAAGALLFMLSDGMLAVDRFRRPFRWSRLAVLSTYFAAQWLIALSVV
jgi:uncharacterized membrane protein YhhN